MRTFVIGDIHGCVEELDKLYKQLPIEEDDRLVFLGDYIDRGPNSRGVIEWIHLLDHTWIALRGNHEEDMLKCLTSDDPEDEMFEWLVDRGGDKTFLSYGLSAYAGQDDAELLSRFKEAVPGKHMEFYKKTKIFYEDEHCICVHAGLDPLFPEERDPEMLLRIRNGFIKSDVDFGKPVIFGHTPQESGSPFIDPHKIGIDTGCFATGILTAVMMPEKKFFQTERWKTPRAQPTPPPPTPKAPKAPPVPSPPAVAASKAPEPEKASAIPQTPSTKSMIPSKPTPPKSKPK